MKRPFTVTCSPSYFNTVTLHVTLKSHTVAGVYVGEFIGLHRSVYGSLHLSMRVYIEVLVGV